MGIIYLTEEELEEEVGVHPCDFSTCFWNVRESRCRLVELRKAMYGSISSRIPRSRQDAGICPRRGETELLPPRLDLIGATTQVINDPQETAREAVQPVSETIPRSYKS